MVASRRMLESFHLLRLTFHETLISIRDRLCALHIVFRKLPAESLLLGKVVGIVEGCEIGDSFLCLISMIRINNLDPVSRRQGIQEIHHAVLMILAEPPASFGGLKRAFDDEEPMWIVQERFELSQKRRAVVGGIREDRVELFHASAFDTENLWRFRNGVIARRQRLPNGSGDAGQMLKLVGELLMAVDEHGDGRHHGFGLALSREHHERLGAAGALARPCGLLRAWRRRGVRFRRWA